LILKSATVPPNPHAQQLAELLCQSGEGLGNSLAHNSFAHTDGEMLMNSSELHCGHLIFHSSATLTFHLYQSQLHRSDVGVPRPPGFVGMTVVTSSPEKRFDLRWCREIAFQRGVGALNCYELRDQQTASDAGRKGGQDSLCLDEHRVSVTF
jgi:hypothetical protein